MIMSQDNISTFIKSCSEGELINDSEKMNVKQNQTEGSRLKRTFTLPRNPFGNNRMSKHRSKQKDADSKSIINVSNDQNVLNESEKCGKKVFRRPSWKKFINKIAHHMNSVGVTAGKQQQNEWAHRVPPVGSPPWPADRTPGATGLRNHGNTCFMNAVLQCLSHTDIIAEYFVLDQYKADLGRRSRSNSRKLGTRGELTEQLALLLKALWACQYYPELSTSFKAIVERHGSQYRGSSQHDAQEFLLWLLDKVHEDLNTATKKKYKTIKNTAGRPDEVVAAETLANHLRCNSSFVQAVFQAQFRSSLACPRCHRQSNTFDPFHCISVQLPHLPDHPLLVTVVYANQQPRCVRLGVRVAASSTVRDLRNLLHSDTGIAAEDIILVEVTDSGVGRTLSDCQPLWVGGCPSPAVPPPALYCVEAPPLAAPPEPYLLLLWVNILIQGADTQRFGSPYVMQVPREVGYGDLQKLILKEMAGMVGEGVLQQGQTASPRLHLISPIAEPTQYLQPELEHPLYTEAVDQALALSGERSGPVHLQLLVEWDRPLRDRLLEDCSENIEQHSSVAEALQETGTAPRLSLSDCLSHYTRAETLAMEDAWRCPQCQQYLPVVKTLGLWSLPDILVIHLKRFRQQQIKGRNSTKLTTMVDFPLYGFDMTPHLADRDGLATTPVLLGGPGWSPWKRPRKVSTASDNSYDLYAVCYHHGNDLETGHYTAACRNPYDQQWYKFDDTRVTHVLNEDVKTELVNNSAYILFYQRRHGNFVGCGSNTSSAASTSSMGSNNDHWASRMPKFTYQPKKDNGENKMAPVKVLENGKSPTPSRKSKTASNNEETNLTNISETAHSRTSLSSLKDNVSECKEGLEPSREDEKNLRNSISLSENLTASTGNVAPTEVSQVILDILEPEKLINKESLYNMGESRRNTLSEYRNTTNEFAATDTDENGIIHRNSMSLTVTPYPAHKDIHVNPKMTVKTTKTCEIMKVEVCQLNGIKKKTEATQLDAPREVESWVRSPLLGGAWVRGDRSYSTLRPRQHIQDSETAEKDHHSDDEAPTANHEWKSSSLRRPVILGAGTE